MRSGRLPERSDANLQLTVGLDDPALDINSDPKLAAGLACRPIEVDDALSRLQVDARDVFTGRGQRAGDLRDQVLRFRLAVRSVPNRQKAIRAAPPVHRRLLPPRSIRPDSPARGRCARAFSGPVWRPVRA